MGRIVNPFGAEPARHAATAIRTATGAATPELAIVLGSGLGGVVDMVDGARSLAYGDVPGFPEAAVAGHAGRVVTGTLEDVPVIVFAGRFHAYEGHPVALTAFPIRVARALGARTLLASNAAGGVNASFEPGDLMVIRDHLNLMGASPLTGPLEEGDTRFPDMSHAYDAALRAAMHDAARSAGFVTREGVYAALAGPAYETPAEVAMLRTLGADAVGMSTVPEVMVARATGMRVAAVSCITNLAAGMSGRELAHEEVLEITRGAATRFATLVRAVARSLRGAAAA